jgi:hypothetical protein
LNLIAKRKSNVGSADSNSLMQNSVDYFARLDIGTAQIKDASITDAKIVTLGVNKLTAGTITSKTITLAGAGCYIASGKTLYDNTQTGFILGVDVATPKFYIGSTTKYMNWDGTSLTVTAPIVTSIAAGTEPAIQGWTSNLVFSATDYRIVAWALGVVKLTDGTTYSIAAGNTGNIAALNYIYLDPATSTTVLQKSTTHTDAVGAGKILLATASPNTDTTAKAVYQVYGGGGGQRINVDSISANSASVNEFVSNTAQIKNLIVTDAKINDCTITKLTAGNLTVVGTLTTGKFVTGATGSNRIEITSGLIVGYNAANVAQFYLSAADGKAYCGAGAVVLDSVGILLDGSVSANAIKFQYTAGQSAVMYLDSNNHLNIVTYTGKNIYLQSGGGSGTTVTYGITPASNVNYNSGSTSLRWNSVYAQNHIIGDSSEVEAIAGNVGWSSALGVHVWACYIDGGWATVALVH